MSLRACPHRLSFNADGRVEKLLAGNNQMLAFEPIDLTALLGSASDGGSLAGALMINSGGVAPDQGRLCTGSSARV